MKFFNLSVFTVFFTFFSNAQIQNESDYVQILGIVQDAGYPHIGCEKDCCELVKPGDYFVSCIGLVDKANNKRYLFDATPDMHNQLNLLEKFPNGNLIDGIFLTHAHIGHYTGLMHLGREVMGAKNTTVNVMPKMENFLRNNGPWSQLVELENISLKSLRDNKPVQLNSRLTITPFKVPHRDEFSETVGYRIDGPSKSLVFIPDIDKWSKWQINITDIVENSDYSLLDGTFYDINELPGRDMSKIPHPFIIETMNLFENSDKKNSIYFIHLNHTNPALNTSSKEYNNIIDNGFNVTKRGYKLNL